MDACCRTPRHSEALLAAGRSETCSVEVQYHGIIGGLRASRLEYRCVEFVASNSRERDRDVVAEALVGRTISDKYVRFST